MKKTFRILGLGPARFSLASLLGDARKVLQDEQGVFAITNLRFASPEGAYFPHVELADQNADIVARDLGIAGLKHIHGRLVAKSGIDAAETFVFNVRVDTIVGMTTPELVFQSPTYTAVAGDVKVCMPFEGFSEEGFQFVSVDITNAGGWVFDIVIEAAP